MKFFDIAIPIECAVDESELNDAALKMAKSQGGPDAFVLEESRELSVISPGITCWTWTGMGDPGYQM